MLCSLGYSVQNSVTLLLEAVMTHSVVMFAVDFRLDSVCFNLMYCNASDRCKGY